MNNCPKINLLVTGGSGFIGKHFIKACASLEKQVLIKCFVRSQTKESDIIFLKNYNVEIVTNLEKGISWSTHIMHIAGQIGGPGVESNLFRDNNIKLTEKIVKLCDQQRIIYISTAGIYGVGSDFTESSSPNLSNNYEKSKYAAEQLVKSYKNCTILRPGFIYGPYDEHLFPFFRAIKKGLFFFIDGGRSKIQPLFVNDLVKVMRKAMFLNVKNQEFIVAGETITFARFCDEIAKALSVKINQFSLPSWFLMPFAKAFDALGKAVGFKSILTPERIKFMSQTRTYDTAKAVKDLDLQVTSLEHGVKETINSFQEYESK